MINQYAQRDHRALGEHYLRHVSAMTGEGLHAKSAIAAELAWRDAEIERLRAAIEQHVAEAVAEEREMCAKVCESIELDRWALYKGRPPYKGNEDGRASPYVHGESVGAGVCMEAIRARAEKEES